MTGPAGRSPSSASPAPASGCAETASPSTATKYSAPPVPPPWPLDTTRHHPPSAPGPAPVAIMALGRLQGRRKVHPSKGSTQLGPGGVGGDGNAAEAARVRAGSDASVDPDHGAGSGAVWHGWHLH